MCMCVCVGGEEEGEGGARVAAAAAPSAPSCIDHSKGTGLTQVDYPLSSP